MELEVGTILAGKVTGITKFGAFVTVAPGKSGLVHISEIAGTYVSDVRDHLTEGQDVTVKLIGVDQSGRMNLSIKAAAPALAAAAAPSARRQPPAPRGPSPAQEPTFEDKLKRFMQDSDSKMSDLRHHTDKRGTRRRGK
jgi:S1 RNA binding domain protein